MTVRGKSGLTSAQRARQVARVLWVTLALNWLTAFLKISLGSFTHCMAVTADGFHSLSDGTSNVVGLIGIRLSAHPADDKHPYGHQKYETLASIAIAAGLLLLAFGIFQRAVTGLTSTHRPEAPDISFAVMLATFVVNLFVVWYERSKARELQSELLLSDSWHTLTDTFVVVGVMAALVGIRLHWPILDPLFSLVIAGLVAAAAFQILKQGTDILSDAAVLDTAQVEGIVRRVEGVRGCHEIRSRGNSYGVYLDLHVLVDPDMSVALSHRLANTIERGLRDGIPGVQDVVVHIEPTTHDHEEYGSPEQKTGEK